MIKIAVTVAAGHAGTNLCWIIRTGASGTSSFQIIPVEPGAICRPFGETMTDPIRWFRQNNCI